MHLRNSHVKAFTMAPHFDEKALAAPSAQGRKPEKATEGPVNASNDEKNRFRPNTEDDQSAEPTPWPFGTRPYDPGDLEGQVGEEDDTALGRIASTARTPARTRSRSASNVPPPPDGGIHAWTQVVAGWLIIFATWGYLNSFGSFQSYYTIALPSQNPSSISWIGSIQAFLTTAVGAFTGRLLDAGFFLPTFAVGAVLQLAGTFAMSASNTPQYWHLMLTQGVMTGLGGGILFTPSLALVATWFGRRRGLAIGLATTGNSTGGIVYPVIVKQLIPRVGFAWTARALGFVNLACFGVALMLMRSRLPPRRAGAVLDLPAFKEGVYVAYVAGLFCFVWANYYTFYYVSANILAAGWSFLFLVSTCCVAVPPLHSADVCPGGFVWYRTAGSILRRLVHLRHGGQRRRSPRAYPRAHARRPHRPSQRDRRLDHHRGRRSAGVDGRE